MFCAPILAVWVLVGWALHFWNRTFLESTSPAENERTLWTVVIPFMAFCSMILSCLVKRVREAGRGRWHLVRRLRTLMWFLIPFSGDL